MNFIRLLFLLYVGFFTYSCSPDNHRRIIVGNLYAEGDISKDSIYNGLIKFYDTSTQDLVSTAHYRNDTLHGLRQTYYQSKHLKSKIHYENGNPHGYIYFFDSTGLLSHKQYSYHGLKVGPIIRHEKEEPANYSFSSFENIALLSFSYDTLQGKHIDDVSDKFFFYDLLTHDTAEPSDSVSELFIYLIDPPKINLSYSLVIINDRYEVKRIIKQFEGEKVFDKVELHFEQLKEDEQYAIRMESNSIFDTSGKAYMFKKITP